MNSEYFEGFDGSGVFMGVFLGFYFLWGGTFHPGRCPGLGIAPFQGS